jgi:hypothetical protein
VTDIINAERAITKECSRCRSTLPLSDFNRHAMTADGYSWQCRPCRRETTTRKPHPDARRKRRDREREREREVARQRLPGDEFAEKKRARARAWYQNNKARAIATRRAYRWRHEYGVSPEQVELMRVAQNNRCGSCFENFGTETPSVDHCHTSGEVRGLLCTKCNLGIGHFQDSPTRMRQGADYIERWLARRKP